MAWKTSTKPKRFVEAIADFAKRVPLTKRQWAKLALEEKRAAFTIAGVAQLQLVAQVHDAIARAIAKGTPLADFKRETSEALRRAWKGQTDPALQTPDGRAARVELIYRNAMQQSYNAGRFEQASEPAIVKLRPYWLFDGIRDARQSEICKSCDGTVLPAGDAWWSSHVPPLHHACRSGIITLTGAQAKREGVTPKAPDVAAQEGFGLSPRAGARFTPEEKGYPRPLWQNFKRAQRSKT